MIKIFTYYLIIPAIILAICMKIWFERKYLSFSFDKKSNFGDLKTSIKNIKELQIYLLIVLILSILVLHFVTASVVHEHAHVEKVSSPSVKGGGGYGELDPVTSEIKPTYDIDKVKEKMEEDSGSFRPDLVYNVTDIDELTKVLGKMGVYRLRNDRILIIYTYVSPYPIVKSFAIDLFPNNPNVDPIISEKTFIYPESPSSAANFNSII